jgi:hypothetical protein
MAQTAIISEISMLGLSSSANATFVGDAAEPSLLICLKGEEQDTRSFFLFIMLY